jgi:hypothetical protein
VPACRATRLLIDNPGYRLVRVRSTRPKLIGRMVGILVTKGNTAHDLAILPKVEILPHERRIMCQCGLWDRGNAQTLREQDEVTYIGTTIDGPIHAEVPIRGNDRDMRRTKEPKILERLTGGADSIPTCHTHALVQLPSDFAPPLFISTGILRTREIAPPPKQAEPLHDRTMPGEIAPSPRLRLSQPAMAASCTTRR